MRSIDPSQARQIVDLIAEEGLSIDAFALEKDFHVGAALATISKIDDPMFDLIFCGGTCLSKAYGLLERLSEDVDIKVVLKPGLAPKTSALKTALSGLKQKVVDALIAEGFDAEQFEETIEVGGRVKKVAIDARDSNRYITFNVRYESRFEQPGDMRSRLQIELNQTSLAAPRVEREAESLFDRLRAAESKSSVKMNCVDLTEAAVEKLISFPRRLAMHIRSAEAEDPAKQRPLDPTLVRHLYDIHEINRMAPETFSDAALISKLMAGAMRKDAADFISQHPEFVDDPAGELEWAMGEAASRPEIEKQYRRFIDVMVYGDQKPDFKTALAIFDQRLSEAVSPLAGMSFDYLRQQKKAAQGAAPGA